jgi:hypothetical protein
MANEKTTRVTASYRRVIQTQQYFSLEVQAGFDEEVSYVDEKDLVARRNELRDMAIKQMLDDLELVKLKLAERGDASSEKRVFVRDKTAVSPRTASSIGAELD